MDPGRLTDVDLVLGHYVPGVEHHGVTPAVVFVTAVARIAGVLAARVITPVLERWWLESEDELVPARTIYRFVTGGLLLGGLSHVFADMLSTPDIAAPIRPLWPVVTEPISFDAIYYTSHWSNLGLLVLAVSVHLVLTSLNAFPVSDYFDPGRPRSGNGTRRIAVPRRRTASLGGCGEVPHLLAAHRARSRSLVAFDAVATRDALVQVGRFGFGCPASSHTGGVVVPRQDVPACESPVAIRVVRRARRNRRFSPAHRVETESSTGLVYATAISLPSAVNDYGLHEHPEDAYRGVGRWVIPVAVLGDLAIGAPAEFSEALPGLGLAFLADRIVSTPSRCISPRIGRADSGRSAPERPPAPPLVLPVGGSSGEFPVLRDTAVHPSGHREAALRPAIGAGNDAI